VIGDCDECVAAALLVIAGVRDDLYRVLWAERGPLGGVERAISDLQHAQHMLMAAGVEQ
jgi:hypothetical protein